MRTDGLASTIVEPQSVYFLLAGAAAAAAGTFARSAPWKQPRFGAESWTQSDGKKRPLTYTKLHHVSVVWPADHQGDKNDGYPRQTPLTASEDVHGRHLGCSTGSVRAWRASTAETPNAIKTTIHKRWKRNINICLFQRNKPNSIPDVKKKTSFFLVVPLFSFCSSFLFGEKKGSDAIRCCFIYYLEIDGIIRVQKFF